jgi:hypothetical protein
MEGSLSHTSIVRILSDLSISLHGQFRENTPSRCTGDIEAALKEAQELKYRPPERKPESGQLNLF